MKYCETCHATYPTDFSTCPKDQSVLRPASELLQGMVIRDKYQVLEKIGSGGMASVYRVRHLAFNEERAIKVVSSKLADDPSFLRRFKTEAVVTRKLQHPNAVRVDDLDTTDDGRPYIVMELVQGSNLRDAIEHGGPMPLERVLNIVWQVCSALATAHQLGITHRDIKPDNILLVAQPNGRELVKVLDFGIAKVREGGIDVGGGYTATQTGMVVGTPQYISPEQALGKHGEEIDGRADLYSLGIVIYEMLTGELPFQSDTPMGLLMAHIQTPPVPPHQRKPALGIPPAISQVLMKALEKDPTQRFQTAGEMLEALRQARPSIAARASATTQMITPTQMAAAAGAPAPAAPAPTMMGVATPVAAKPTMLPTPRPERLARRVPPPPAPRRWPTYVFISLAVLALVAILAGRKQSVRPLEVAPQTPTVSTEPAATTPAVVQTETPEPVTTQPATSDHAGAPSEQRVQPPVPEPSPAVSATATPTQRQEAVARLLRLGKQQAEAGQLHKALATFRMAQSLDPDNALAAEGVRRVQAAIEAKKPGKRLGQRR